MKTRLAMKHRARVLRDELRTLVLDGVGDFASTPDHAALDITGDIDVRVAVARDNWQGVFAALVAKLDAVASSLSYRFAVHTGVGASFGWHTNVSFVERDSTEFPPTANGDFLFLRTTLDVDNGAAGHDLKFYTKPFASLAAALAQLKDNTGWTQLGATVTTASITAIQSGTSKLYIGARNNGLTDPLAGKVLAAVVMNGINGTVVADPDFSVQLLGTATFEDGTGKTWTLQGDAGIALFAGIKDAHGHRIPNFIPHIKALPCHAWMLTGRTAIDEDKTAVVVTRRLFAPLGSDIRPGDRIDGVKDRRGVVVMPELMRIDVVGQRKDHLEVSLSEVQ